MRQPASSAEDLVKAWRRLHAIGSGVEPAEANPLRKTAESVAEAIAGLDDVQTAMVFKKALIISRPRSRAIQLLKAVLRLEMAANGIPQSALLRDDPSTDSKGPDRD